jgi:methylase of polypeptide subunit release factors
VHPLLPPDDLHRLRDALQAADYTSTGIATRIGPDAVAGVTRGDLRGLLRATSPVNPADRDRLATLIRLFLAATTEPAEAVAAALAPLTLEAAASAGLVEPYGDGLHAGVDLDVYTASSGRDFWILSDLDIDVRPGPLRTDHVLGVGNAATTLAQATVRQPVRSALDIGTGCGVQALELSGHAERVAATDVSDRALRFAATTAVLNGLSWELLAGDLAAPVTGRRFDLIVSNPPFVIGPGTTRYTYRDSGRPGDAVCAELARAAGGLLTEGGTMQFLANWVHVSGEDWHDRVTAWVADTGCDAWIVQRELSDPVEYVNLWMRDAAEVADPARAQAWLDWFDAQRIEAVGYGLITLRRNDRKAASIRISDLRAAPYPPTGTDVDAWFDRQEWLATHPDPLEKRYTRSPDLRLTQQASHDGTEWTVDTQMLAAGLWSQEVDPITLALVSGADGTLTMAEQIAVLASAFDTPEPALAAMAGSVVIQLVERGMLAPSR